MYVLKGKTILAHVGASYLRGQYHCGTFSRPTFVLNSFMINETHDGLIVQDLKLMSLHNSETGRDINLQNRLLWKM